MDAILRAGPGQVRGATWPWRGVRAGVAILRDAKTARLGRGAPRGHPLPPPALKARWNGGLQARPVKRPRQEQDAGVPARTLPGPARACGSFWSWPPGAVAAFVGRRSSLFVSCSQTVHSYPQLSLSQSMHHQGSPRFLLSRDATMMTGAVRGVRHGHDRYVHFHSPCTSCVHRVPSRAGPAPAATKLWLIGPAGDRAYHLPPSPPRHDRPFLASRASSGRPPGTLPPEPAGGGARPGRPTMLDVVFGCSVLSGPAGPVRR